MSDDRDWLDELYAEGREEPPAALDGAVLAAARENATRPWYRNLRYLTTVATAASFVLAAMVIYYAPEDDGFGPQTVSPRSASAPSAPAEARAERAPDGLADRVPSAHRQPGEDRALAVEADQASTTAGQPAVIDAPTAPARPALRASPPAAEPLPAGTEPFADRVREEAVATSAPEPAGRELTPDIGRSGLTSDTAQRQQRNLATFDTAAKASAEAKETLSAVLAGLIEQCGPAPGTDEARRVARDALGWYLVVTAVANGAEGVTYYRCEQSAWQEIDAPVTEAGVSEQEPDPDDDQ